MLKSKSLVAWGQEKGDRDCQEEGTARICKENFESDGYTYYFHCHSSFINISVCQKLSNCAFKIYAVCYISHITQ